LSYQVAPIATTGIISSRINESPQHKGWGFSLVTPPLSLLVVFLHRIPGPTFIRPALYPRLQRGGGIRLEVSRNKSRRAITNIEQGKWLLLAAKAKKAKEEE